MPGNLDQKLWIQSALGYSKRYAHVYMCRSHRMSIHQSEHFTCLMIIRNGIGNWSQTIGGKATLVVGLKSTAAVEIRFVGRLGVVEAIGSIVPHVHDCTRNRTTCRVVYGPMEIGILGIDLVLPDNAGSIWLFGDPSAIERAENGGARSFGLSILPTGRFSVVPGLVQSIHQRFDAEDVRDEDDFIPLLI